MINNLNIVILEGRVARTADLLYTKNGNAMCKFELATSEYYKTNLDEYKTVTSFITIYVWGKYGESNAQFLTKGKPVRITGSLKQENWEDKNGNRVSQVYVNANSIEYME